MSSIAASLLTVGTMQCPHYDLVPKDFDANLRFRTEILAEAARDEKTANQLRVMCAEDLLFYVNTFCLTYDPRCAVSVTPFITYDFQDTAMLQIADCVAVGEDFVMPKSRDMGASWMGLTVFEWYWHFKPDLSFLLVSRNEDYVDKRGNTKSQWKKPVMQYVHGNRAQIFADILHRLKTHKIETDDITPATRYPEFEERVLRAMCRDFNQYNVAVKLLADSRASANIDEDQANQIENIIRAELVELGMNPEKHSVFITMPVLKAWVDAEIDGIGNSIQTVRNYAKTGLMPRIDKTTTRRRHGERRSSGVRWLPAEEGAEA